MNIHPGLYQKITLSRQECINLYRIKHPNAIINIKRTDGGSITLGSTRTPEHNGVKLNLKYFRLILDVPDSELHEKEAPKNPIQNETNNTEKNTEKNTKKNTKKNNPQNPLKKITIWKFNRLYTKAHHEQVIRHPRKPHGKRRYTLDHIKLHCIAPDSNCGWYTTYDLDDVSLNQAKLSQISDRNLNKYKVRIKENKEHLKKLMMRHLESVHNIKVVPYNTEKIHLDKDLGE